MILNLIIAVALISVAQTNPVCLNEVNDPCLAKNHVVLNDPSRSSGYRNPGEMLAHDSSLVAGWYKSESPAGGDMPTSPQSSGYCQAAAPIWMNGTVPSVNDGIVSRTACTSYLGMDCKHQYQICVKNCGSFRVYHLPTPNQGTERYCFGSEVKCPKGLTSQTGYSPNCKDPCHGGVYNDVNLMDSRRMWTSVTERYGPFLCDKYMVTGDKFYRMREQQGIDYVMPETCVDMNRCGTVIPIWLNDTHPKSNDSIVSVNVCSTFTNDKTQSRGCCFRKWTMDTKLCYNENGQPYYVYKLKPPEFCESAYCVMHTSNLTYRPTIQTNNPPTTELTTRYSTLSPTTVMNTTIEVTTTTKGKNPTPVPQSSTTVQQGSNGQQNGGVSPSTPIARTTTIKQGINDKQNDAVSPDSPIVQDKKSASQSEGNHTLYIIIGVLAIIVVAGLLTGLVCFLIRLRKPFEEKGDIKHGENTKNFVPNVVVSDNCPPYTKEPEMPPRYIEQFSKEDFVNGVYSDIDNNAIYDMGYSSKPVGVTDHYQSTVKRQSDTMDYEKLRITHGYETPASVIRVSEFDFQNKGEENEYNEIPADANN